MALSKIQLINFFKELAPYTSQCSSPFYASVELVPQKTHLFKIVIEAELTTEGDHELEVITGYNIVLADFTEVVFNMKNYWILFTKTSFKKQVLRNKFIKQVY
jgi:hypothetical protein